jgi:hypothetical protein
MVGMWYADGEFIMRGQVLPMWISSTILGIIFSVFIGSYGYAITYQFRAQAAADSAANAAVAIQSLEFNQMIEILYATGVEEYRIRHLLESLRLVANYSGGCNVTQSCPKVWTNLVHAYKRSLYRYDTDAHVLNNITSAMSFVHQIYPDEQNLIQQINASCQKKNTLSYSLKCNSAFHFYLDSAQVRTSSLNAVQEDAQTNLISNYSSITAQNAPNRDVFAPVAVQVTVCVEVPSIFPAILGNAGTPTIVIAHGAATDAQVEEDWIQPGNAINPVTKKQYQPKETYGMSDPSGANWYSVDFGGNASTTQYAPGNIANSSIQSNISNEEYSARTGWWGPIPIMPFTKGKAISKSRCPA